MVLAWQVRQYGNGESPRFCRRDDLLQKKSVVENQLAAEKENPRGIAKKIFTNASKASLWPAHAAQNAGARLPENSG